MTTLPSPGPARLLLVDDDEEACRLLAEVLEREAYDVVPALSADEALAKVEEAGPFDAVLTDLRMPDKSGLDLLRVLRQRDPGALVLVLTAFGDAAAAGEAIRAGAYDFISKPYDLAALGESLSPFCEVILSDLTETVKRYPGSVLGEPPRPVTAP